jgi:hypothetical protein
MIKSKPFTVIMQPHIVAHRLTRRALKHFSDLPDDADTYSAVYDSVLGTMGMAAANGDLVLRAFPLWYRVPAQFTLGDNGWLNTQGVGITLEDLFDWVKSFDPDIAKNHDTLDYFWEELQGDVASPESETEMNNGARFLETAHGKKAEWFADNTRPTIRDAIAALGLEATRPQIIKWACDNHKGTTDDGWKKHINTAEIAAVKYENREK